MQRSIRNSPTVRAAMVTASVCCAVLSAFASSNPPSDKIPITTTSDEARELYLKGRDLAERLRATDAHRFYEQAVEKDKNFALGYLGLATTSGTTKEFIDRTTQAASLAGQVSEGERHMLLGLEAGMKGNPAGLISHYTELVRLFPNDERAHNLLANAYFGRQDYETAVKHFTKATAINPSFSQPYNQMGYAYRFLEKYDLAEQAFKKYTELIPNDPNPYDSYGELLMKVGRFDESIKMYGKALAIDPNFVASYIGIGNDYVFMGKTDQARAEFAKILKVARTTGERRQAHFWTAASYLHDGAADKAIGELKAEYQLAEGEHDYAAMSGDLAQMGEVLLDAGRADEGLAKFGEAAAMIEKAQVPEEVKAVTRRNHLFEQARVALAKNDVATAKAKAADYATQVAVKKAPVEVRQQHEVAGLIALAEKRDADAVKELQQANQQDPRVLYWLAVALQRAGDTKQASIVATKSAKFNALSFNYGYVRSKATKIAGTALP
jgi:tetratricopeptide (TPR) repeat protein